MMRFMNVGMMLPPQLLNTVVESAKHYPGYLTTKPYHCQALHTSIAYVANYKHNITYKGIQWRVEMNCHLPFAVQIGMQMKAQLGPKFCTLLCTWCCLCDGVFFNILAA